MPILVRLPVSSPAQCNTILARLPDAWSLSDRRAADLPAPSASATIRDRQSCSEHSLAIRTRQVPSRQALAGLLSSDHPIPIRTHRFSSLPTTHLEALTIRPRPAESGLTPCDPDTSSRCPPCLITSDSDYSTPGASLLCIPDMPSQTYSVPARLHWPILPTSVRFPTSHYGFPSILSRLLIPSPRQVLPMRRTADYSHRVRFTSCQFDPDFTYQVDPAPLPPRLALS